MHGVVDDLAHRFRHGCHQLLDGAGGDAADALRGAPIVPEHVLVEIGLQVLGADRARMRAEQPAFQQRDGPVRRAARASASARSALVCTIAACRRLPRLLAL